MTVSFFSYKGGVGRTTLVANVGWALAHAGLRVLLIDCDLEAPGLLQYFTEDPNREPQGPDPAAGRRRAPDAAASNPEEKGGLLDLLEFLVEQKFRPKAEFRKFSKTWAGSTSNADVHPDLERFINPIAVPPSDANSGNLGRLHVVTPAHSAGSLEYARRLQDFSTREFDARYDARNLFAWLKGRLTSHYDLILVDSRTGYSEIGRLIADALADAFVFVMAPNRVNLDGTGEAIQYFRGARNPRPVLLIPSRLPTDLYGVMTQSQDAGPLSDQKRAWLRDFNALLSELKLETPRVVVPHSNVEGGVESLATRSYVHGGRTPTGASNTGTQESATHAGTNAADDKADHVLADRNLGQGEYRFARSYFQLALDILGLAGAIDPTRRQAAQAVLGKHITGPDAEPTEAGVSTRGSSNDKRTAGAPDRKPRAAPTPPPTPSHADDVPCLVLAFTGYLARALSGPQTLHRAIPLDDPNAGNGTSAAVEVYVFPPAAVIKAMPEENRKAAVARLADHIRHGNQPGAPESRRCALGLGDLSGFEAVLPEIQSAGSGTSPLEVQSFFQVLRIVPGDGNLAEILSVVRQSVITPAVREMLPVGSQWATEFRYLIPPVANEPESYKRLWPELDAQIGYAETTGSALKWWEAFKSENANRPSLVVLLQRELIRRKATITEFFLAYVYSNTDNIQANLHYLDYTRLKKEEEKRRREQAEKDRIAAGGSPPEPDDAEIEDFDVYSKGMTAKVAPGAEPPPLSR